MLGFIKTDLDVGYYTAAVKVKGILVSVVTSVGTVLLPRASYYVDKGMLEELYKIAKKAMNLFKDGYNCAQAVFLAFELDL